MNSNEIHKFLTFNYAIVRSDGKAYTGSVHGDDRDWATLPVQGDSFRVKNMSKAFTYTATGASRKIAAFPVMFAGCKSVNIHNGCKS